MLFSMAMVAVFAVLAGAAGDAHHASSEVLLKDFIYRTINFAALVGIVFYFVAKPFKKSMADRKQKIEADLKEARTARAEAEAKFKEVTLKLQKASEEIEKVRLSIHDEGEAEKNKIIANARQAADKIRSEAEKMAAREIEKARAELRKEASRLAIALAEELIRKNITAEDQERLVSEYLANVGELH